MPIDATRQALTVLLSLAITSACATTEEEVVDDVAPAFTPGGVSTCRVGAPLAPRARHRGSYLSLASDHLGQLALPAVLSNILGKPAAENTLLAALVAQGIDAVTLYDLHEILGDGPRAAQLSNLIAAMRGCGIAEIVAVGASTTDFERVALFQRDHGGAFDGLVTELEFWNGGAVATQFEQQLALLRAMRDLNVRDGRGQPAFVAAYIGWLDRHPTLGQAEVASRLAHAADRLYVHCYVRDPANAYGYCRPRIEALRTARTAVQVFPIFSAEGPTFRAGGEIFMGDWLRTHALEQAESIFSSGSTPSTAATGFQVYDYATLVLHRYSLVDGDGDLVPDQLDNCRLVHNPDQRDTDADGLGNRCDADFDNSGVVTRADLAYMRTVFGTSDAHADLDGDGVVSADDRTILRSWLGRSPGPGRAP